MFDSAKQHFLGVTFHNISFSELCSGVDVAAKSGQTLTVMSLNLDILTKLHSLADFRAASERFSLVLIDSTPLLKLARKQGIPVSEKLSGSDIMPRLCEHAAASGQSCFILGGASGVPERAAENLQQKYPGLQIAGTLSPEYGFTDDPGRCLEIAAEISASGADIVFVCLGAPKAELFIDRYLRGCGIPAVFSVGAAVDFAAGSKQRAPLWMQRAGLEWFFRFCQEPKRLFRRYFVESWRFLRIYLRHK